MRGIDNNSLPSKVEPFPDSMPLEECLIQLCLYGQPRLSQTGSQGVHEWHCSMDMFCTGTGVAFSVKSSFKEPTPRAAVNQCWLRMVEALQTLGLSV